MTKSEVQKHLSDYKDDEEFFVMCWDKEFIDFDNTITDKQWNEVVARLNGYAFENINENMHFIMEEELANIKE